MALALLKSGNSKLKFGHSNGTSTLLTLRVEKQVKISYGTITVTIMVILDHFVAILGSKYGLMAMDPK